MSDSTINTNSCSAAIMASTSYVLCKLLFTEIVQRRTGVDETQAAEAVARSFAVHEADQITEESARMIIAKACQELGGG